MVGAQERQINSHIPDEAVLLLFEFQDFLFYAMMSSEPRFHEGIAEFNRRRFFEAHEVWEDLWHLVRDDNRVLLQGLIQIAAGCYHLQTNNFNGAFSLLGKGLEKLERYGGSGVGIDLEHLVNRCEELRDSIAVRRLGGDSVIDDQSIPTIAFLSKGQPTRTSGPGDPEGDTSWRQ